MSVSKKGRRKIVIDGSVYWWSVDRQHSGGYNIDSPAVHIISDDKTLDVCYRLSQASTFGKEPATPQRRLQKSFPDSQARPVVEVRRGLTTLPREIAFPCLMHIPMETDDSQATPRLVRQIIEWCREEDQAFDPISMTLRPTTDDESLARVKYDQLNGLRYIAVLYLSNSQITDNGLRLLADLTTLHSLFLTGTSVTNTGLLQLRKLGRLRFLNVMDTSVTHDGVKALGNALRESGAMGRKRSDALNAVVGGPKIGESTKYTV